MGHYYHSLSVDATIMVSINCPIIGEHVGIRELVKTTILEQDPPLGWEGDSQRYHLSSNITNSILLAFKFELTQEYSASKSRHY